MYIRIRTTDLHYGRPPCFQIRIQEAKTAENLVKRCRELQLKLYTFCLLKIKDIFFSQKYYSDKSIKTKKN